MEPDTLMRILQLLISAGAGILGVGIGIGLFRGSIKQLKEDVNKIQTRQSRLRGEDNGGVPLYMTQVTCEKLRSACNAMSAEKSAENTLILGQHTKMIKAFENFARWWMQDRGLNIEEINHILDVK